MISCKVTLSQLIKTMNTKAGRNDPCPCGSGKKYKNCCMNLERPKGTGGGLKRKFSAKVLQLPPKPVNLMERAYGDAIKGEVPSEKVKEEEKQEGEETSS